MSADAIDAIARMMSESRCRGKFRGLRRIAMGQDDRPRAALPRCASAVGERTARGEAKPHEVYLRLLPPKISRVSRGRLYAYRPQFTFKAATSGLP